MYNLGSHTFSLHDFSSYTVTQTSSYISQLLKLFLKSTATAVVAQNHFSARKSL